MGIHYELKVNENEPFLVLDLGFDIVDSVGGFNLESNGFARKAASKLNTKFTVSAYCSRLHEDLHLDADAFVYPTMLTMESLTKARAGRLTR